MPRSLKRNTKVPKTDEYYSGQALLELIKDEVRLGYIEKDKYEENISELQVGARFKIQQCSGSIVKDRFTIIKKEGGNYQIVLVEAVIHNERLPYSSALGDDMSPGQQFGALGGNSDISTSNEVAPLTAEKRMREHFKSVEESVPRIDIIKKPALTIKRNENTELTQTIVCKSFKEKIAEFTEKAIAYFKKLAYFKS